MVCSCSYPLLSVRLPRQYLAFFHDRSSTAIVIVHSPYLYSELLRKLSNIYFCYYICRSKHKQIIQILFSSVYIKRNSGGMGVIG